jgi:mannose-6-phosphate isomerase-like protein (cupin superfamily)
MDTSTSTSRRTSIVTPNQGRHYTLGDMHAVFKADGAETDSRYSISEWWLEPNGKGPGEHMHPEDHVFYVIEGTVSLFLNGQWCDAERGTYALIPGGNTHTFENRGSVRCGFMSVNVPGGFELKIPSMVQWFEEHPPRTG